MIPPALLAIADQGHAAARNAAADERAQVEAAEAICAAAELVDVRVVGGEWSW